MQACPKYQKTNVSVKTLSMKIINLFILIGMFPFISNSQDLMNLLDSMEITVPKKEFISGTFKSPRLINGYTCENAGKHDLVFSISHRFNPVKGGVYDLFGLDESTMRLGFEYGLTDRFSIALGRSNFNKLYDGYIKWKLVSQSSGEHSFPLTITWMEGMAVKTAKYVDPSLEYPLTARFYYVHELFIARKFTSRFSAQLVPTVVHRNMVDEKADQNVVPALGLGGNFIINKWLSVNGEYYYLLPGHTADNHTNSLSVGVELDSGGGHVFQIMLSNSNGMTEKAFIPENNGNWTHGDIQLGFNIIRVFHTKKKK